MHRSARWGLVLAFALAILIPAHFLPRRVLAQNDSLTTLNWPFFGNDLGNSRYQNADQINPANVAGLQVAWVFHTGVMDEKASLESSPIVVDGTMYVTDGHDDVFALNASTGEEKWSYRPALLADFSELSICCGRANRGAAFGNGKVFVGQLDDVLVALNSADGTVAWSAKVVDFIDRYSVTMAPQFIPAMGARPALVIVGVSGGEFKVRGQVVAYNAETGKEMWRFFTTSPGTWGGDSWKTGGATLWNTPAVDMTAGLLYFNTGNAAPDINGVRRIGQNRNSSSVVALDIATGRLVWAFQMVHHDLWDYDSAQPAMLFPVMKNGQILPAIGECSKNGNYYILDRRNGQPIFPVQEVSVPTKPAWQHPWPTQPVSSVEPLTPLSIVPGTVDFSQLPPDVQIAPQYTPPQQQTLLIAPGDDGGCEWPPAAFSPRTGFVYYGTRYEPSTYHTFPSNHGPNEEGAFLGSSFEEKIPGVTDFGLFGATDTVTGKVMWKIKVDQPAKSGLLVAGDLVFFGEGNGNFHAVNAATGETLWTFNGTSIMGAGGAQASPVAYVVDGHEFIVNAFGGNAADRGKFPPNPAGDAIVAFSLPQ